MKAVVMAGGEGSRLRPLTIARPKPMVPLVDKPVMEHIIALLKRHGITDVVVTLQYLATVIQSHFGDGSSFGVSMRYSIEETPLGTAGSVKNAERWLDDTFLLISGDALTDFDLSAIIDVHRRKKAMATIALYSVPNPLEYGVVITDEEGRIKQFLEKPTWGEVFSDTVNTGIYVLEPEIFKYVPAGKPFDFSQDLFPIMLRNGDPLFGYVAQGYWCDVGNLQEYMRATADLLSGRVNLPIEGERIRQDVWAGLGVEIDPQAQLFGPIYIGQDCRINPGVIIHGPTVIRDYSIIDDGATVDRSIIWRNSYIGRGAQLRGTIVCSQCTIKENAAVFEDTVIGDNTIIGEGAIIRPGVRIWPAKEVEPGATVTSSIIWPTQARRTLFGRNGVSGRVNIDITPEFAARLGAAYASTLPKGALVAMNRDPHRTPRMIKRALISGLPSAGVNVLDIKQVPIPVARYTTRTSGCAGAVHVRLDPEDPSVALISFMDQNGLDIDARTQRKIESAFFREDFRRVYLSDIGRILDDWTAADRYAEGFLKAVDVQTLRRAGLHVVVDYAYGSTSQVLPGLLGKLGCDVVAINAALDEERMSVGGEQLQQQLRQLSVITSALRADLGVRIDNAGERLWLVDGQGEIIPDTTALAAITLLACRSGAQGTIAVPVTAPRVIEAIAAKHGVQVQRTKVDAQAIMAASARPGVMLAGDGQGRYCFPQFQPAFDGMYALARLLELLAAQRVSLADVVRSLPRFYMHLVQVACPWQHKGKVMRLLNETQGGASQQIDGVMIDLAPDEWVLVLPDADRPLFHVYAEGPRPDTAAELAKRYAELVSELQR